MALLTYAEFIADPRFAKFGSAPFTQDWVEADLADVESDTYEDFWCDPAQRLRAMKLLLAHRLSLYNPDNQEGVALGEITSISSSDGSQSLSFGSSSNDALGDELLKKTHYGIQYLALKKRVACYTATGFVI